MAVGSGAECRHHIGLACAPQDPQGCASRYAATASISLRRKFCATPYSKISRPRATLAGSRCWIESVPGCDASIHRRMPAPVDPAAENRLHDQMVGGRGGPDTNAEVDLPIRGHVEVGDEEHLLLLIVHGRNIPDGSVVGIPLE